MKKAFVWLLVFTLMSSRVWADSDSDPHPDQRHIRTVKKQVAECVEKHRRVFIETYDDRRLQGFISEARPDDFVLGYANQTTTLNYADVKKIKWPSPAWRQVKIFAGAAAIAGALFGLVVLLGGLKG